MTWCIVTKVPDGIGGWKDAYGVECFPSYPKRTEILAGGSLVAEFPRTKAGEIAARDLIDELNKT